jgi:hypothetical protein
VATAAEETLVATFSPCTDEGTTEEEEEEEVVVEGEGPLI